MYHVTHSYVWCDWFIRVTWLICMCDMTHVYAWHGPSSHRVSLNVLDSHTHTHTHAHTHTHTHAHTHKHKHTQTLSLSFSHTHTSGFRSCVMYILLNRVSCTNEGVDHIWQDFFICVESDKLWLTHSYGMATISRLFKIVGPFCKRALQKRLYSANETCNLKEPTNRSQPITKWHAWLSQVTLTFVCVASNHTKILSYLIYIQDTTSCLMPHI